MAEMIVVVKVETDDLERREQEFLGLWRTMEANGAYVEAAVLRPDAERYPGFDEYLGSRYSERRAERAPHSVDVSYYESPEGLWGLRIWIDGLLEVDTDMVSQHEFGTLVGVADEEIEKRKTSKKGASVTQMVKPWRG